jgi:hypothetical protein
LNETLLGLFVFSSRLLCESLKYRTIIFPVVLHGYETWSVTLREKPRLSMFCSTALRKLFGPESDEETGDCRRLHNEEFMICIAHRILLGCPGDHVK